MLRILAVAPAFAPAQAMAEGSNGGLSGTVEEIVSASQSAAGVSRAPAAAMVLRTLGFWQAGDGGEAIYRRAPAEPSHPGKFQSQDGCWWELEPTQRITPQMFGAVGNGSTDDTLAFNLAIAFCRSQSTSLHVPRGDYLLSGLTPLFTDKPPGREQIRIEGAGRDLTRLCYAHDLSGPLLDAAPAPSGRLAGLDLIGLTIDGRGFSGPALRLSHMSKCSLRELKIQNVRDIGLLGLEWWDSTLIDVLLHNVGDPDRALPSMRLANRDVADANSSCNNLGIYDLHIEEHPYRAIEIQHTSRKLTFTRLKCHHNPRNYPPAGTDHIVLNALAAPAGAGYGITFQGCHLAVCSGSAYVLDNTGGAGEEGFKGISINGGSIQGPAEYGIKAMKTAGLVISDTWLRRAGKAGIYVSSNCRNVFPVWATIQCDGSPSIHYGAAKASTLPSSAARIEDGAIPAIGEFMMIDAPKGAASGILTVVHGGKYGQTLYLAGSNSAHLVTVRIGGNIRTKSGLDRYIRGPQDTILLRYDEASQHWNEITYSGA